MIKVITLDFWNTIVDTSHGEVRRSERSKLFYEMASRYNRELSNNDTDHAIGKSIDWFNQIWKNESRTVNTQQIIQFINSELSITPDEKDFNTMCELFEHGVLNHPPDLAPDLKFILPQLSEKFKLGIISDTHFSPGRVLRKVLDKHGILQYFDAFSFSDELGVSKPHEKMFKNIMEQLNCRESEMIHIGDLARTDIKGASDLGILSILYCGINDGDKNNCEADFCIESWSEIPTLLSSINNSLIKN